MKYKVRIEADVELEVEADDRAEAAQEAINEFLMAKLYTVHVEEV